MAIAVIERSPIELLDSPASGKTKGKKVKEPEFFLPRSGAKKSLALIRESPAMPKITEVHVSTEVISQGQIQIKRVGRGIFKICGARKIKPVTEDVKIRLTKNNIVILQAPNGGVCRIDGYIHISDENYLVPQI